MVACYNSIANSFRTFGFERPFFRKESKKYAAAKKRRSGQSRNTTSLAMISRSFASFQNS